MAYGAVVTLAARAAVALPRGGTIAVAHREVSVLFSGSRFGLVGVRVGNQSGFFRENL